MTLDSLIDIAIQEDLPSGDVTTDNLNLSERNCKAHLVAKEDLILSGQELFEKVFSKVDSKTQLEWKFKNSDLILKNQIVCILKGNANSLLKAERVALNFLGHLSGIATLTRCFVDQVKGLETKILDTRKTTPGFRGLEKKAVLDGGGTNHRMNLSDAIMIKDNHIEAIGSITEAVRQIRDKSELSIEVETRNLQEVREAVACKVKRIMLDNMDNDTIKQAMHLIPYGIEVEASGNMSISRVRSVAELGVHFISVGALTHSAPTADFSLQFDWGPVDL